jgi:hemerythrin-like metal-binding protein
MSADWMPELTVNHAALDDEHHEIFQRLKVAALSLDGPRDEADRAMSALAEAIVDNLAFEERLMEETLYPDRARHRAAHELFMADFTSMRDVLREQGASPSVLAWLNTRLPEWLRFHIRVNDAPLAAFLVRRGPRGPGDAPSRGTDRRRLS